MCTQKFIVIILHPNNEAKPGEDDILKKENQRVKLVETHWRFFPDRTYVTNENQNPGSWKIREDGDKKLILELDKDGKWENRDSKFIGVK